MSPQTATSAQVDQEEPFIQTPSTLTNKKILFIHGAWHGEWCWETFTKYFTAQGYECHTLNLRGHDQPGVNQKRINWHSLKDYVLDVANKLDSIGGPDDVILVGHSMGGMVVQKYLEQRTCAAAILLASVPPSGVLMTILRFMRAHVATSVKSMITLDAHQLVNSPAKARWAFFSSDLPEDQVQNHAAKLCGESYLAFMNMMRPGIRIGNHKQVPILVLGAKEDRVFTVTEVERTAKLYNAPCHIFPGIAHDMMMDKSPLTVALYMKNWLEHGITSDGSQDQ